MKRTVLTTVISSLLTVATTNAMASAVKTAPASVTEAQHNTAIASENYHAALTTFNAAPSSEREYAAGKLDTAHDKYTTAVLAEKVAIKQWLTPDLNVAPTQVAASPAAAPSLVPQATPVSHAVPVAPATPNVPQSVPQAAPAAVPSVITSTPAAPVAQKEINVPHMGTYSAPSLLQRNPTAPAIPTVSMPHVEVVSSVPAPRGNYGDNAIVNPQNMVTTTTLVTNVPAPSVHLPTQLAPTQKAPNAPVYNVPAEQKTPVAITQTTPSKIPAARVDQIAPAYPKSPVTATPDAAPTHLAANVTPNKMVHPDFVAPQPAAYNAPLPVNIPTAQVKEVAQAPVVAPYHVPVGKETVTAPAEKVQSRMLNNLTANHANVNGASPLMQDAAFKAVLGDLQTLNIGKLDVAADKIYQSKQDDRIKANEDNLVDANHKIIGLDKDKADKSQVNALAGTTHATDVDLQNQIDKKADKTYVDSQDAIIFNQAKVNTTQQVTNMANALGQHIDDVEDASTAYTDKAVDGAMNHADKVLDAAVDYTDQAVKVETDRATAAEAVNKTTADKAQITADTNTTTITKLAGDVAQKVDLKDFKADQIRQDTALNNEANRAKGIEDGINNRLTTAQGSISKAQSTADGAQKSADVNKTLIAGKADVKTVAAAQDNAVTYTDQSMEQAYTYADKVQDTSVTYTDQVTASKADKADVTAETARATKVEQTNSTAINTETTRAKKAEQANTTAISTMTTSVNANTAGVAANRRDIDTTSTQVNKNTRTLANHEQRITSLEQQTNKQFGALKNQIDENHKEAMAGASSALAASQIPQVSANRDFSVGAGAGTYGGESAVAVGFSARINDRVVTKFAVTGDTQQKFGAGAGVSWEFGN